MKTLSLVAAAMLMTATGAVAAEPEAEQPAEKEKKICKTEKITGSLTRVRRICMTKSEWAALSEGTNQALDRMGRSANQAEALTNRTAAGAAGGPPPAAGHTF